MRTIKVNVLKYFICGLAICFCYFTSHGQKADTNTVKHLNKLSVECQDIGKFDEGLQYANEALELSLKLNFKKGIAFSYNIIGILHLNKGDYDKSLESHLKSLAVKEEIRDKSGMAASYGNIGSVFSNKGDLEKALEFNLKSLAIREEMGNKQGMSNCYANIGIIHWDKGNIDKALEFMFKALPLYKEFDDKLGMADTYSDIGILYSDKKDYDKALEFQFKSLAIKEEMSDKQGIAISSNNIGTVYLKLLSSPLTSPNRRKELLTQAKKQAQYSLSLAKETGSKEDLKTSYELLSLCDTVSGNWKGAYVYNKLSTQVKDSILNEESGKQIAEMQTKYETVKKEQQIMSLNKDSEIQKAESKKQKIVIGAVIIGLLLVAAFSVYVYRSLKTTRQQKLIIEEKQKDILDSIHYAKRIQRSLLPTEKYIGKILTKPKSNKFS